MYVSVCILDMHAHTHVDTAICILKINRLPSSPLVGVPSCPSSVVAVAHENNITVTWQQLLNTSPVTSTTVTYCPTSSPNCGNSMTCTSPCNISGLYPGTEYLLTVIPNSNCGSPTGCTGNKATAETACECVYAQICVCICVHYRHLHENLNGEVHTTPTTSQPVKGLAPMMSG